MQIKLLLLLLQSRQQLFYINHQCSSLFLQVCELDIIFNFEKAYFMLDELLIGGELQETSKKNVLKAISAQDLLQEVIRFCVHVRFIRREKW